MDSKVVDPLNTDELNRAAYEFQQSIKLIKMRTSTIPKKSMERVFDAVVEFPLADKEPKFRNKVEHELFLLTLNALSAKNRMMEAVMANQNETVEMLKEADQNIEGEINGET